MTRSKLSSLRSSSTTSCQGVPVRMVVDTRWRRPSASRRGLRGWPWLVACSPRRSSPGTQGRRTSSVRLPPWVRQARRRVGGELGGAAKGQPRRSEKSSATRIFLNRMMSATARVPGGGPRLHRC
jgi:hypothetical protein